MSLGTTVFSSGPWRKETSVLALSLIWCHKYSVPANRNRKLVSCDPSLAFFFFNLSSSQRCITEKRQLCAIKCFWNIKIPSPYSPFPSLSLQLTELFFEVWLLYKISLHSPFSYKPRVEPYIFKWLAIYFCCYLSLHPPDENVCFQCLFKINMLPKLYLFEKLLIILHCTFFPSKVNNLLQPMKAQFYLEEEATPLLEDFIILWHEDRPWFIDPRWFSAKLYPHNCRSN